MVERYAICHGRDTIYDTYRGTYDYYVRYLGMAPLDRLQYAKHEIQDHGKVKMLNVLNDLYALSSRKIDPLMVSIHHNSPAIAVDLAMWYREVNELYKALINAPPCSVDPSRYVRPTTPSCNHLEHLSTYLHNSPVNRLRYLEELVAWKEVPDELLLLISIDLDFVLHCNTTKFRQRMDPDDSERKWLRRSIRVWRKQCH